MPELIWDGKYDAIGKRTAPPRVALPFQTVETVNESRAPDMEDGIYEMPGRSLTEKRSTRSVPG
jgi:hypothetical protein